MVARVSGERLFVRDNSIPQGRVPVDGSLIVGEGKATGLIHYSPDGKRLPFWVETGRDGTMVTVEGDGVVAQVQTALQPTRSYHPKDGDAIVREYFLPRGKEAAFQVGGATITDVIPVHQPGRVDRFLGASAALIKRMRPK